jgi:DNA-binding transcriptional LysR family regulator
MEIRHLRYFLAVADHGSVAEAARQLHIAQPALSRQIKDIEEELGADLFRRSAKGAELTAVGVQFALDARRLVADMEAAKERAIRVARGQGGTLRIGVSPIYSWHPTILSLVHDFRQTHPDVTIRIEPALAAKQLDAIAEGKLDAGFMGWRDESDPRFEALHLFDCTLRLAIPQHGPFAFSVPTHLADLKDKPCIWFDRENAPAYYDFLIRQCQMAGFLPKIAQFGGDVTTILGMVAAGMGYSIVPDTSIHGCPSSVLLAPHPELTLSYPVEFVWRHDPENTALDQFIENVRAGFR